MSKKFRMDKEDARIINAHIRKVQKGPKERSRPRSRPTRPTVEASRIFNISSLNTSPNPEDSIVRITMTREEYEAEIHISERLRNWMPQCDVHSVDNLAKKLRRTFHVRFVSSAPVFADNGIVVGDENYLRMPLCFKFFPSMLIGEENAIEINIGTVLSWYDDMVLGNEPRIHFNYQGRIHRCNL